MDAIRDPETMTADERRDEVASILAAGLLRRVRQAESGRFDVGEISSPNSLNGLDLPSKTRLSVSQRPAG